MLRALFSIGFRPFFLAAGWLAAAWILLWITYLHGGWPDLGGLSPILWHGHEMLFGFTAAVIAGFVLTAVQNWTGLPSTTPASLGTLVVVWALARLGFLFPELVPLWLTSIADLAFFPLLGAMMTRVLLKAENHRNYAFIPLFAAFSVLNLLMHLEFHGLVAGVGMPAMQITVYLVTVLLVFMGGRVIPFFTSRRLPQLNVRQWPWLNWASTLSVLAVIPAYLALGRSPALAPVLLIAAMLTLARLLAWQPWSTWRVPMLWILHLSYFWIPLGLLAQAAHLLGFGVSWSMGVHALMVGAMGGLCLGMMARVSLGHSGRPLEAHPLIAVSFGLIVLATASRLLMAVPGSPAWLMGGSAVLWASAFVLFAAYYTPILLTPRQA